MSNIGRIFQMKHFLLFNAVFWLILCVIASLVTVSILLQAGITIQFGGLIRWPFSSFLSFWILSFAVIELFLMTRKYKKFRWWLFHIIVSILFGFVHKALTDVSGLLLERLFLTQENKTWQELLALWPSTYWDAVFGVGMYWMMIVILTILDIYRQYREQQLSLEESRDHLLVSRLETMKIQLQPHFLFNALNTISMMVRRKKVQEAIQMISGLSEMLRSSFSRENKEFVTLHDELKLINHYLAIESVRYQDRLQTEINVASDALEVSVPSLILQPIVENAFKHGISKCLEDALLKITIAIKNDHLNIEIYNTRPDEDFNWDMQRHRGIGLHNTLQRLMQLYKGDFKFHIYEKDMGVSVQIVLPVLQTEKV